MGFLDDVQAAQDTRLRPCRVRSALALLDDDVRTEVEHVMGLPLAQAQHTAISAALRKRLGDAGPDSKAIARHRKGDCSCG